ncbi:hypothetical protein KKF91_20250 [Myxococcota bacterium]|nr:hypothetical protein [Myxococcota bacterium]MBU1432878.1 hypothetical protein [Myxococcota bacterium]MBU1898573.1 hypothetical protein [Myxococcota bacterium]
MRTPLFTMIALALSLTSCEILEEAAKQAAGGDPPEPPTASLAALNLLEYPSEMQLGAYYCNDLLGNTWDACVSFFGKIPKKSELKFSFETVFELGNPNTFPVPTVELLLALDVFEGAKQAELAALCVSFCDPQAEVCDGGPNPEACRVEEGQDIMEFEPTINDLLELAVKAATEGAGAFDDNLGFKVIPSRALSKCRADKGCEVRDEGGVRSFCCGDACEAIGAECRVGTDDDGQSCVSCPGQLEAHVRFDLGLDAMLGILEVIAEDAMGSLLDLSMPNFTIPYKANGTLFFDIPIMGRFSLNFGPLEGEWTLD